MSPNFHTLRQSALAGLGDATAAGGGGNGEATKQNVITLSGYDNEERLAEDEQAIMSLGGWDGRRSSAITRLRRLVAGEVVKGRGD